MRTSKFLLIAFGEDSFVTGEDDEVTKSQYPVTNQLSDGNDGQ